jgi:hypothetical protein
MELHVLKAGSESEIETAVLSVPPLQAGALVAGSDPFFNSRRASSWRYWHHVMPFQRSMSIASSPWLAA